MMGGRGTAAARNSSRILLNVDEERLQSYNFRDFEKKNMSESLQNVKNAISNIEKDPWNKDLDVDVMYEILADYYPRHMDGDESEKVVGVDWDNEYVTTVKISLWENRENKIQADLQSGSYSFSEFSKSELEDMGIDQSTIDYYKSLKSSKGKGRRK